MRTTRKLCLGALPLVLACRSSAPSIAAPEPVTLSSAAASTPSLKDRMRDHAARGEALRGAVERGDLDAARREARALAELRFESGVPVAVRGDLQAMNVAAARVASARDLPETSRAAGTLARTCSDCHSTLGGPGMIAGEPDDDAVTALPPPKRHAWATARLWSGLVAPSHLAWMSGARVLADAPLVPESRSDGAPLAPAAVTELATSVHALAESAQTSNSAADRERIMGELLATCAACHAQLK